MSASNGVVKALRGNSKGQTLVEVLIALAILGIVAVAFMTALTTASRAIIVADEHTTAESLARSQLEYVKNSDYIDYSKGLDERDPDFYEPILVPSGLGNYTVEVTAEPINPYDEVDPDFNTPPLEPYPDLDNDGVYDKDAGMQRITVKVRHQGKLVLTTEDYKVHRYD